MEQGSRGRGRGRPKPTYEAEPSLRRPHSQNLPGTQGMPIIADNKEQVSNPYENQPLQELIKTATNVVSTQMPRADGNCNQANIAISPNLAAMQSQTEVFKQDIASLSHSAIAAGLIDARTMAQLTINPINQAFTVQDTRACQVLPSPVIQTNTSNIIHNVVPPFNVIQKGVPNMVQNPPANLLQRHLVASHGLQQFPKNHVSERIPVLDKNYYMANQLAQDLSAMSLNNLTATTVKSNLSADAPVFIPKSASITTVPSSPLSPYYDSVNLDSGSLDQNSDVGQSLPPHALPQLQFITNPALVQVNNLVVSLTLKPHKYGHIAQQLTSILSWQVKEVNLMKEIISVIFEQGVGEANFRYNGARLCQYINKHITQSYNGPSFRDLLIRRCQDEFSCRDFYLQHNCERLCGFALFLADIFSHLVTASSHYVEKLQTGVCGVLMTLMSKPSNDTFKCVAKVLKGTGYALDSCGTKEMDKVMAILKDVAMTAPVSVDVRTLLLSIIELRASNWGRGLDPNKSALSNEHPLGTVYYGPNGDILKVVSEDNEDSASDTDDSYFGSAPEEDEEFFKAYDEFLKSQAN